MRGIVRGPPRGEQDRNRAGSAARWIHADSVRGSWAHSPIGIALAVRRGCCRLGEHIEDILSAPTGGIGIVRDTPHAPFGLAGHWIHGNAAEKPDFAVR